ncbi:C6 zinc finger domain-containing protein [Pochonia chlamydosporia 170]|uniref:C6 zinc finger domain-containing protein n=1 Tax=Pochonia chlamydosporia 170 TaxID=1380566 RepID=A0A179FMH7_METCM|nr:C6 zinc finger domain-containing protein [Pochonia chlamydosporia 170]OAQ66796.2 C6 zinc finger domain-containing protein [Pochonia chlamydosporia 170]
MPISRPTTHSKSRNGCLRCKAKKTKCDERKPSCARCQDRGFQCPGYALDVRWSHKHQVRADRAASRDSARNMNMTFSEMETEAVSQNNPPGDNVNVQLLDSEPWLASPSQWSLLMPQELFALNDAPANTFLLNQQPSLFESDLIGTAWTVDNESSSSPSDSVENPPVASTSPAGHENEQQVRQNESPRPCQLDNMSNNAGLSELVISNGFSVFPNAPKEIHHLPTALSEYFFREVITLYCLWDSKSNVMRNIVETMWQSSGALHHTIQSMAAACLCEDFPHLRPVARSEHTQALEHIHKNSSLSTYKDAMLLAATLLGHTSSWLNPQNLATDMFRASCGMLNDIVTEPAREDQCLSFFSGTMDYWAMLLAYLTDSNQLGDYRRHSSVGPAEASRTSEPHPYSGISHDMVRVLTDIGILIFQYRKHMLTVKFMSENDLDIFKNALREARRLERLLLAHRSPQLSQFKDPGDPKTPLKHLELIDEAYRCTGLLQLYRVFPDLLNERYAPWDKDHLLRPLPSAKPPTAEHNCG